MREFARRLVLLAFVTTGLGVTGGGVSLGSDRPAASVWAIDVPYGQATAHQPNFDDKQVWPFLTGKERFLKTSWPKARTLVWAHPGSSAGRRTTLDPLDPKNWIDLETGKPASSLPDSNTDVVVPAADKHYILDWQNAGHGHAQWGPPLVARCVTVGRNADFRISDAKLRGNVWVQRGGFFIVDVTLHMLGADHTFFRNDNTTTEPGTEATGTYLCQYLTFNKASRDASAEFLGMFHSGDEFQVLAGTMIIGPDSVMEMGREAYPYIAREACLALLDNAYLAKWTIDLHCCDMQVRGGALLGGLPDRPLSRSAIFRVSHKNHSKAVYTKPISEGDEGPQYVRREQFQRCVGLVLHPGSTLRSHTSDASKARLVITQLPPTYPITFLRPAPGSRRYAEAARDPRRKEFMDWLGELPQGIDVAIGKDVTIEAVEFDCLRKGGLMVADPPAAKLWKDVFRGKANLAADQELFGDMPSALAKGHQY